MSNVKLAIRVRPFSDRELKSDKDRVPVVNVVDDHTVTITNIKVSLSGAGDSRERIRRYYADYTFDSSCAANLASYATQEKVFECIGREVMATVSQGSSACVMAYGQSATGKTHTMMGTDASPGLVPRLCHALADLHPFELTVSFLEIYNERVHDLLVEAIPACHSLPRRRGNARKDLRVREHPTRGPYVQNLRRVVVTDVGSLLSLVEEGTRRRRTAPTRRNSTSSRSHALLDIVLPHGTLHLADLAGSEKASWEGCGGGRQKEGANINKSLVALSNVISALVSGGSGQARFVPYRDSALTWLLKDCFTGGANTFIIATVSPSIACYGESASTLRWAERARRLPTPKLPSCGITVISKAALQAQYNQLIAELSRNFIQYIRGEISYDDRHWELQVNKPEPTIESPEAKIGSIMNRLHPKPDAKSESASSVASESSDVINTMDKNIRIVEEINKEVDKLFVPTLERTSSSTDLKVVAPLRHKRRQYRSQEILQVDEAHNLAQNSSISSLPIQIQRNEQHFRSKIHNVPILHDSQRAEIVASVTERLYSKLKKKEEHAVSKVESVVEKKIMEPLSELRICTNARQRLMELSQKAMRNKRRIGIPAYTQTRITVKRVKDQSVDVQTDLESYIAKSQRPFTFYRDVGTETIPMTPRCKEIAVGSKYGTLDLSDRATITENEKIISKNAYMMTDPVVKCEQYTQTAVIPPPRRRKQASNLQKYINNEGSSKVENISPVISINISSTYPVDSESQSSDDNIEPFTMRTQKKVTPTPDLLTNHCDISSIIQNIEPQDLNNVAILLPKTCSESLNGSVLTDSSESAEQTEDFPDNEDCTLPRVTVDSTTKNSGQIKNMILGRNANLYPYNIVLSPPRERDTKRIVTFKDSNAAHTIDMASQTVFESNNSNSGIANYVAPIVEAATYEENPVISESICSDTTDSSKMESNSFIWKQGSQSKTLRSLRRQHTPVYKTNPRYRTRAKFYRDFLGLGYECNEFSTDDRVSTNYSSSDNLSFKYEEQLIQGLNERSSFQYENLERSMLRSCNDLDKAVNKYEDYLNNFKSNRQDDRKSTLGTQEIRRTPTQYMKHLVNVRREVVKLESAESLE